MPSCRRRIACLSALLMLTACVHAQTLRLGSWDRDSDPLTIGSEAILSKAYGELKQPVEFIALPLRRALSMLQAGELDGNLHRAAALAAQQSNLVRVPTQINTVVVRIYTKDGRVRATSWQRLAGRKVAFRRGVLIIERHLPADVVRVEARSEAQAMRMLAEGVVDAALAAEPGQSRMHPAAVAAKLQRLDGALNEEPLYHYLLARHSALAARLDAVLKRMQASGESDQIRARASELADAR